MRASRTRVPVRVALAPPVAVRQALRAAVAPRQLMPPARRARGLEEPSAPRVRPGPSAYRLLEEHAPNCTTRRGLARPPRGSPGPIPGSCGSGAARRPEVGRGYCPGAPRWLKLRGPSHASRPTAVMAWVRGSSSHVGLRLMARVHHPLGLVVPLGCETVGATGCRTACSRDGGSPRRSRPLPRR